MPDPLVAVETYCSVRHSQVRVESRVSDIVIVLAVPLCGPSPIMLQPVQWKRVPALPSSVTLLVRLVPRVCVALPTAGVGVPCALTMVSVGGAVGSTTVTSKLVLSVAHESETCTANASVPVKSVAGV